MQAEALENVQQAGPGFPPQGVGSPDPYRWMKIMKKINTSDWISAVALLVAIISLITSVISGREMTRVSLAEKRSAVSFELLAAERASKALLNTMLAITNKSPDLLTEIEKVKFSSEEFPALHKYLLYNIDTSISAEDLENLRARIHRMAELDDSRNQELNSTNNK